MAITCAVRSALRDGRIDLVFQPVCDISTQDSCLYYECLARFVSQGDEGLQPDQFIPALERSGFIQSFDRYMVLRVVEMLQTRPDITLGVNISAASAEDDLFWDAVTATISKRVGTADRLVIEVTETAPVDPVGIRILSKKLQRIGCRIAVDDFGVGYSRATAMAIGRADIIKIDASILREARYGAKSRAKLGTLVEFAARLGRCVVIEGVESEEDIALVSSMRIKWAQGYHLGLPADCPP
ncbi:EAL domain-containing protein (plasmid) [Paraburkholderia acidicola]|uniref:EAL domain-containing protein n=1 Tax=Paraburkholderia acidicola TaxID=1912599 RepID=A0ABV1LYN2_9BURK